MTAKTAKRKKNRNAAARKSGGVFLPVLISIAAAGVILRLLVAQELGSVNGGFNSVYTPSKLSDLATYMTLAHDIAAFRYSGEFYYQPFYYAVFLPVLYWLSGGATGMVIFAQSLLGGATAALAGLTAGRLFGRIAGYTAAVLTAISTPLLLYAPFHQNETLQAFNLTLLLCLAVRAVHLWSCKRWLWVGIVCGIAILTRGNIWFLVPGIAAALLLSGRHKKITWKKCIAALAVCFAAIFAVQLPFIWHNSRIRGTLTGPSTAANAVLALGNSAEAPAGGRNPGLPAGPMEYPAAYSAMMERVANGVSVPMQMWEWMCREPGAFFELQFRKLLLFWDYREIPNNVSLYGEGEYSAVLRYLIPGRSALLLAMAFAGLLIVADKRRTDYLLLLYFILAYWGAVAVFYILSRFRAPILPVMAVAAGGYLGTMIRRWRLAPEKRRNLLLFGGGALVLGFYLTSSGYEFYRSSIESGMMKLVRPAGTSVSFGDRTEVFDYGPFTFGGWAAQEIAAGDRFSKHFAVPGNEQSVIECSFECSRPGVLIFRLPDGRTTEGRSLSPGIFTVKLPPAPEYELVFSSGEHRLLFDTQRNYSRSSFNSRPLAGEWLMRQITPGRNTP